MAEPGHLEKLEQQIRFFVEIDKLKQVQRRTFLMDASRRENSAEHSWHLAVMAMVLSGYAREPVDLLHVIKMLLVHDIVEIDADDTFLYDEQGALDKREREELAATRLFGLLPAEQAAEFRALWEEYEARQTPEARFAAALDRFQPMLHNYKTDGAAWRAHGITSDRVLKANRHMGDGAPALWEYAQRMVADAVAKGFLQPGPAASVEPGNGES